MYIYIYREREIYTYTMYVRVYILPLLLIIMIIIIMIILARSPERRAATSAPPASWAGQLTGQPYGWPASPAGLVKVS